MAFVPSFVLALVMAVALGLMVHLLVFRPLRNASALGKVVGSLGVLLYLQGIALLNFGTAFRQPKSVVPEEPIEDFLGTGNAFPRNTFYCAVIAVLIGLALWLIYRYTRFGLATRAAAGNEKGAVLLGYSPNRLAATNWVLASVVATLSAIIVGPIQGTLTPVGLTALVVPALGAALIGGLTSIMIATFGGLALGAVQSLFGFWSNQDWFPEVIRNGVREAIPLLAIALVLFLRGDKIPLRGTVEERRLARSPYPIHIKRHIVIWSIVVVFLAYTFTGQWAFGLTTAMIAAILMVSYVVLTGYVGQISLVQLSLAGVAAFFMARMMADGSVTATNPFPVSGPDFPWPIAAVLGIAMAVVVGLVLGLPALRIRGVQLAVVTIAAAVTIQTLYLDNDNLTGIRAGAPAAVSKPTLFGIDLGSQGDRGLTDRPAFTIFVFIVLVLCMLAAANIRRTGTGRRFLAVRANERAAAAAGVGVASTKLLAFAIAAALAGVSGVMLGFQQQSVSSAAFIVQLGLILLAYSYLGGITSINGAVIGGLLVPAALVVVFSNHHFADANIEEYAGVIGGIGLVLTAIIHPEGIAPFFQGMVNHAGNWVLSAVPTAQSAYQAVVGQTMAPLRRPLQPTAADAGAQWVSLARRFGPTALAGAVLGYLIWPFRVDSYSSFWMPLLGALLALLIRSIVKQVLAAARGEAADLPGHTDEDARRPPDVPAAEPAPMEVGS
jgi:ABC-type branched-subunit amino acid transport system permease subunit